MKSVVTHHTHGRLLAGLRDSRLILLYLPLSCIHLRVTDATPTCGLIETFIEHHAIVNLQLRTFCIKCVCCSAAVCDLSIWCSCIFP